MCLAGVVARARVVSRLSCTLLQRGTHQEPRLLLPDAAAPLSLSLSLSLFTAAINTSILLPPSSLLLLTRTLTFAYRKKKICRGSKGSVGPYASKSTMLAIIPPPATAPTIIACGKGGVKA